MARLVVSEAATADLLGIQLYGILTFGLQASDRYSAGLKAAMVRLADFPRLAQERSDLNRPVRVLSYGSHVVVYAIDNDIVHVLRIRHASEDWHGDPAGDSSGDQP